MAELIVKFDLPKTALRKCHDKLKKIADGLLKVRYVGHALRAGDDKDNRRS